MTVRVGINGFGRIGRNFYRALTAQGADVEIVGVNDLTDNETLAHLLKYDTILGRFPAEVTHTDDAIMVGGTKITTLAERDPAQAARGATSAPTSSSSRPASSPTRTKARAHVDAGAKKVIISAPAKNEDVTVVMGVNDGAYDPAAHTIISNASCTTNCLAPMAKVLHETFGIEHGLMTTIHAYTNDQVILDFPHKDLRRARAAALNIDPDHHRCGEGDRPGAARAQGQARRLRAARAGADRLGHRPDRAAVAGRPPRTRSTPRSRRPPRAPLEGLLEYTEDPIVSTDIVTNPASCIFDAGLTKVIGDQVKVLGWYDNEWGYSNRLVDLVGYVGARL